MTAPLLRTARLFLDGFLLADADEVARLLADEEVARYSLNVPHPYPPGHAPVWIADRTGEYERGEGAAFAIRLPDRQIVGCVGLRVERRHDQGELGFWLGRPFWGQGYATEAARACLTFAFASFDLHKVVANHAPENPASGRVLQKLGMVQEGLRPEHVRKDRRYYDSIEYGLLRSTFNSAQLCRPRLRNSAEQS